MDEYISKEKVVEKIRYRVCQGHGNKEHICQRGSCAYCGIMEIMSDISSIEAADVEPVRHECWIYDGEDRRCSGCKAIIEKYEWHNNNWNFCYHCGARMNGGNSE